MKRSIFIVLLAVLAALQSHAQSVKTSHMVISIVNTSVFSFGKTNNMFITRDDSTQVQKSVDLNPHVKSKDKAAAFETLLFQLIEPYYQQGWKLISTSVDDETDVRLNSTTTTYRYYFVKGESQ